MSLTKTYVDRLDADLNIRVGIALTFHRRESMRKLHHVVQDGTVTLVGHTNSIYERQLAIESIRRVAGVFRVIDRIEVPGTSLHSKIGAAAILFATLLLSGCGGGDGVERLKVHPVQGTVTFAGKPLANAQVAFHPKNPTDQRAKVALGTSDANGNFQLTTYDTNDGAVAGEFSVTVQYFQLQDSGESFSPGPNVLSPHIATPEGSNIVVRVAEGLNQLTPIEVRR